MSLREQTYYELLEIGPRASREEVQVAYNRSRAAFSQNSLAIYSLFSPEECALMQQRIDEAYRTLMNEDARRRYDASIGLSVERAARPSPGGFRLPPGPGPAVRGDAGQTAASGSADTPASRPWSGEEPGAATRGEPGYGGAPGAARGPDSAQPALRAGPAARSAGESAAAGLSSADRPAGSPAPPLPDGAVVTGAYLRKVRESRGIELRQIAQTTKVGLAYLQLIEEENFQQLPVPAYLRGFLKAYARYVGLDPDRVSRDYLKLYALYHEIKAER